MEAAADGPIYLGNHQVLRFSSFHRSSVVCQLGKSKYSIQLLSADGSESAIETWLDSDLSVQKLQHPSLYLVGNWRRIQRPQAVLCVVTCKPGE